ncbi:MAG: nicotinamide-nucleotide amidohydrolase family protein [Victivallales bacterium]|nr:nicotinamide-nucleotide amidohydrolase family protein [Victivallales bacterium]
MNCDVKAGRDLDIRVVCIGNELLKGFTVNTNLADIGRMLTGEGLLIKESLTISDSPEEIVQKLDMILKSGCDVVVTTGGLGPTKDDLTKKAVADYFSLPMVEDAGVRRHIEGYWTARNCPMPESVLVQALVPKGAVCFRNEVGTAPGMVVEVGDGRTPCVILLPGPPAEMIPMFRDEVLPYIAELSFGRTITETICISGIPESIVESRAVEALKEISTISLAYCASIENVKIYISSKDPEGIAVSKRLLKRVFKGNILPVGVSSPAEHVARLFMRKGISVSFAESCTGGMVAAALTGIPGASRIFKGSIVAYSNEWKKLLLDIPGYLLDVHGAVSAECAGGMVEALCRKFGSDAGVAITGVAGPSGGTAAKPVGLVYIAARLGGRGVVREYRFPGGRERVRMRSVSAVFNLLTELYRAQFK